MAYLSAANELDTSLLGGRTTLIAGLPGSTKIRARIITRRRIVSLSAFRLVFQMETVTSILETLRSLEPDKRSFVTNGQESMTERLGWTTIADLETPAIGAGRWSKPCSDGFSKGY